ncbi:MAG TPA: hypothetical protein ENL11_03235 [Candidatus Acetothermia bacterium]|nr:hypothetical protein [Candidatus Acetothermia bacterium]
MRIEGVSKEELKEMFREAVEEALLEVFGDPDEGLKLRPEIRERLKRSLERIQQGEIGISAEEVAKQKGLVW